MHQSDSKFVKNIFDANLRFVRKKANDYRELYNLPYDECEAEGKVALIEAARRFDPTKGFTPLTYAYHYIEGRMNRLLNKEILRRNHQAEVLNDKAYDCREDSCRADSEVNYNDLIQLIQQYVDGRYYPGLAQKYLEVKELSSGYKEREVAAKCNMDFSFFQKINLEVRALLKRHHYC